MSADVRVLLVDDDEDDAFLTTAMLQAVQGTSYVVEHARSAPEADALLLGGTYDVHLVDYRLGAATGLEVAQRILGADRHAAVVMLTGLRDHDVDVRAAELGIADYLVKGGLDAVTLERSLRYAIRQQAALRALSVSEERFALCIAGANDGVWDLDLVSHTLHLSARWKTLLGYDATWGSSDPELIFDLVHPEERDAVRTAFVEHLAGRSPHCEAEYRALTADGGYRWVLSRGLAVRDVDGVPTRMAGSLTDVHERKRAEHQLQHDALHDGLTGLPNRALFLDRLRHAMERRRRHPASAGPAVLFLDLDRFKVVNDSLGHGVGDRLLVAVADRLSAVLRPGDTVARLGGDEFTILLEGVQHAAEAEAVAQRVLDAFVAPVRVAEHDLHVSTSIGLAVAAEDAVPHDVIRDADAAMYRAKALGRNRLARFDAQLHDAAVARLDLETRLRRGLAEDRSPSLHVAYQPIVRATDGGLAGFEALARWREPDGSPVTPDRFIPVAEETGLIVELGRRVLLEACEQLRAWRHLVPDLTMAVNISGRQLLEPGFAALVEEALAAHDLPADALRLEITESAASTDYAAINRALERLQERTGIRVQLDDFGTGTSSLTFLRDFPGDALKIDRSFVLAMDEDGGALQIVRAICRLGKELGIEVVAEGVETDAQRTRLQEFDCEYLQGFLLARPLAPDDATALVRRDLAAA